MCIVTALSRFCKDIMKYFGKCKHVDEAILVKVIPERKVLVTFRCIECGREIKEVQNETIHPMTWNEYKRKEG